MKSIFKIMLSVVIVLALASCQPSTNKSTSNEVLSSNGINEDDYSNRYMVNTFFKEFQEKNDGWTKTEEGHKKLINAFKEKITSDLDFAKACASYNAQYKYNNSITASESISAYSREDGEEGEIKAFDFKIDVDLIKPLYNGQKQISVKYEIISTIPSTIEEHWRPYVDNANYCDVFDPFLKNSYDATLDLGCYIITKKGK